MDLMIKHIPLVQLRSNFRKRNKIKKSDIIIGYAGRYADKKISIQC